VDRRHIEGVSDNEVKQMIAPITYSVRPSHLTRTALAISGPELKALN